MNDTSDALRNQFSIAGVLLILTSVAVVLALAKYGGDSNYAQIALLVVIVGALPLSWAVEFFIGRGAGQQPISEQTRLARIWVLLACSIIPMLVFLFGILGRRWTGIPWLSPIPLPSYISANTAFYLFPTGYLDRVLAVLPSSVLFIYLCLPIIRTFPTSNLPVRSSVLLSIYTLTNLYWLVTIGKHFRVFELGNFSIVVAINIMFVVGLWGTWLWRYGRFTSSAIVIWNLALVTWLFWFSHPLLTLLDD